MHVFTKFARTFAVSPFVKKYATGLLKLDESDTISNTKASLANASLSRFVMPPTSTYPAKVLFFVSQINYSLIDMESKMRAHSLIFNCLDGF